MTTVEIVPMTVSTSSTAEMATVTSAPPLASSLPPPPPPPPNTAQPLSESQFRHQLLSTLHSSGTLTSLKTQLKSSVIQQLIQRKLPALLAANNPPPAVQRPLIERLANSLILDYLLALSYTYTHSLFLAELGAGNKEEVLFAQHDTLDLLRADQATAIGQRLLVALSQSTSANASNPPPSVLLALLSTLHTHAAPSTADIAIQTDSSLSDSLEQKLKAVDDELSHTLLSSHPSFSLALEQRMAKLQRETNDRAQHELHQQLAHYKQTELADARREERDKHQQQLRDAQQQLAAQHSQQLKEYKARLDAAEADYERKVRAMDEERYVGRQRLMDEMDACKAREAELQRLELLMKREVGVEAEVWKERNGRLEVQLSGLAEERRRLEERIVEERRRVEEQLTAQLAQKDEQLRSLREASDQLRTQYDRSIKDNLSLTQQLADTQRQHIAMSSSSSLVAAAEARAAHLQQQLTDQQRTVEYEKAKHADELKELMWSANVAVERERERGHTMLVKLSNEWKDAYDTLMAEYERVEAERDRKVWRERSGGKMERRTVGVARRTAWEEGREDEEESAPISQHDAQLQSSSFGGLREQQRRAQSAGNQQLSSSFPAFTSSPAATHSPAVAPSSAPLQQRLVSTASPAPAPLITITSPPAVPSPTSVALTVPSTAAANFASPASPATTIAASPFPSPTTLDSPLPTPTPASPAPDPLLFTPPPTSSRLPFVSPTSSLPFPTLSTPATPLTELDEAEERRRAVEAVERGREEAKRGQLQQVRQRQQDEVDERRRLDREVAERTVREERDAKLRQEEETRRQQEEQLRKEEADREAEAAEAAARKAKQEQEARETAEREGREQREALEQEEAEEREREERERRELAEVKRMQDKRDREEKSERRRAEREEQKAEEERRRLEEQERELQASMTEDEKREQEQREQRRRQQRQEAEDKARQAAQQRSTPPQPQPVPPAVDERSYSSEDASEDEAATKERDKKARMDDFLRRAKERRDRERQAERDEADRRRREALEAEERRLTVAVKRGAEVEEDIEEELEVETADEAYTADEFEAASESAITDEVEVEAEEEIEEDLEL